MPPSSATTTRTFLQTANTVLSISQVSPIECSTSSKIRKKDCNHCRYINRCIDKVGQAEKERIKANRVEYKKLLHDEDCTDVIFDKRTGGVKATHRGHITHDKPNDERFFEGLTTSDLERVCQGQLFRLGHRAVFLDDQKRKTETIWQHLT